MLTHEFDEHGGHRLYIGGNVGDWAGYAFIATLEHNGKKYAATTDYYDGTLPAVFEVVTVPYVVVAP